MPDSTPVRTEAAGWRGHVILLFADLCDYTSLSEASDPEDVDSLRHQIEARASAVIQRHGGAITQVYGDGILAVFGFPASREDDARRAVDAALALHEMAREGEFPSPVGGFEVRLHTGVHGGLVFVREGDVVHGKYELTGDAVNTAARLCAVARRDEIVVSGAVLQGIEGFFETDPVEDLQLKGKKVLVPAYRVTRRSAAQTRYEARSRRGLTTFISREPELARLISVFQAALAGQGRLLVLSGAAGMGKSRLLEELRAAATASSARVFMGACESYGDRLPLEPFRHMLRQLFDLPLGVAADVALRALPEQLAALAIPVQENLPILLQLLGVRASANTPTSDATDLSVIRVFADLIAALSQREPVLLLLDDWQWADDTSRKLLDCLLRMHLGGPVGVVVAVRSSEPRDPQLSGAETLDLEPFDEADSARLIAALRPRALDLGVTRAIHRRAGGNPLFLEELCRSLSDDALNDERALAESGTPTTLHGVIQARLSSLPAEHAQALSVAAVIGMEFSLALLGQVLRRPDLGTLLEELSRGDLIYATARDTYRFKHGITRDVIYESVRIAERRRVHGALAHAITQSLPPERLADQAEALALHHRGSGDHEHAAKFAELAGNKAMLTSTLDRARLQYQAALQALDRLTPSDQTKRRFLAISASWTHACVYSPARDQLALLQRAASYATELGETGAQAQTQYSLGWIHYVLGDCAESIQHYRAALELAELANSNRLMQQLWANLGQSFAAAGQYDEALSYLSRSIDRKRERDRRETSQVAAGFAYALGCRASVHSDRGDAEHAERDLDEALASLADTAHAVEGSVRALQAMTEIHRGDYQACLLAARRSRQVAERVNSAYVFATASSYEAYAEWRLDRRPGALQRLRQAVEWLEVRGVGLFLSFAHGLLAEALWDAGEAAVARDYATRALARAARQDPLGEAMAYRTLARLAQGEADGGRTRVEELLAQALRAGERRGSPREERLTRAVEAELLG